MAKVAFDKEQTPKMLDVKFKPLNVRRPKVTVLKAYLDAGAEESMVSQDLVKWMSLCLEKDQVKPLKVVDGALVECHGRPWFALHP